MYRDNRFEITQQIVALHRRCCIKPAPVTMGWKDRYSNRSTGDKAFAANVQTNTQSAMGIIYAQSSGWS